MTQQLRRTGSHFQLFSLIGENRVAHAHTTFFMISLSIYICTITRYRGTHKPPQSHVVELPTFIVIGSSNLNGPEKEPRVVWWVLILLTCTLSLSLMCVCSVYVCVSYVMLVSLPPLTQRQRESIKVHSNFDIKKMRKKKMSFDLINRLETCPFTSLFQTFNL